LGWNSYGTEGAQPLANVRLSEGPKMAGLPIENCCELQVFEEQNQVNVAVAFAPAI
jgi:hypothetical protein